MHLISYISIYPSSCTCEYDLIIACTLQANKAQNVLKIWLNEVENTARELLKEHQQIEPSVSEKLILPLHSLNTTI